MTVMLENKLKLFHIRRHVRTMMHDTEGSFTKTPSTLASGERQTKELRVSNISQHFFRSSSVTKLKRLSFFGCNKWHCVGREKSNKSHEENNCQRQIRATVAAPGQKWWCCYWNLLPRMLSWVGKKTPWRPRLRRAEKSETSTVLSRKINNELLSQDKEQKFQKFMRLRLFPPPSSEWILISKESFAIPRNARWLSCPFIASFARFGELQRIPTARVD